MARVLHEPMFVCGSEDRFTSAAPLWKNFGTDSKIDRLCGAEQDQPECNNGVGCTMTMTIAQVG